MSEESDKELLEEDFPTSEHVHVAAYYKWQHRGCGHGESLSDWVEAHKEITQAGR
jgi:hypothetical protein